VSFGVSNQVSDGVALAFVEFSSSESWVESQNFADEKSESSTDTLDFIECEWDGSLSVNVSIENTVNMFEVILSVFDDQ